MTTHTQEASMAVSDDELAEKLDDFAEHLEPASKDYFDEIVDLRLAAARLRETGAGRVWVKPSSYLPLPMSTAPKDATLLRLLVKFDSGNDDHHPLEDSDEPQWTMGTNHLSNTGEDEWLIVGWNWTHDCFTTSGGEPLGWLPLVPPQPEGCGLPCGYDCNGACFSSLTQPQADEVDFAAAIARITALQEALAHADHMQRLTQDARNAAESSLASARQQLDALTEALTPSGATKAAYIGEFSFPLEYTNDDGDCATSDTAVPWTTIKEIMAAIRARAALRGHE